MIDNGEGSNWSRALTPDRRSLKFLTEAELHDPFILHKIQQWHGCDMEAAQGILEEELGQR